MLQISLKKNFKIGKDDFLINLFTILAMCFYLLPYFYQKTKYI